METILDSKTTINASDSSQTTPMKAMSAPIAPLDTSKEQLKVQFSAPSYLYCLKENEAPPFKKSEKEARPQIVIGTIINETEVLDMIAAANSDPNDGFKKHLGNFLVQKKIILNYNLSEKKFLINLLSETVDYAAQRDMNEHKLACLLTIYLSTHMYFKWYYWLSPVAVWKYFKELMIRHTIEDSPDGEEVFEPDECYDIVTHFHTLYLTNLPLIHIITFGAYRLKFLWPFKPK